MTHKTIIEEMLKKYSDLTGEITVLEIGHGRAKATIGDYVFRVRYQRPLGSFETSDDMVEIMCKNILVHILQTPSSLTKRL